MIKSAAAGLLLVLSCALGTAYANQSVEVSWAAAEHYVSPDLTRDEFVHAQKVLTREIEVLGKECLAPEDQVTIEVVDMSLAGRLVPHGSQGELRILNGGADWPRMTLRFRIERAGTLVREGQASLAAMDYLQDPRPFTTEPFIYERRMLRKWFRGTLADRGSPVTGGATQ
jgi:hypothetical protein